MQQMKSISSLHKERLTNTVEGKPLW
jgi:hypothetical protein